MVSGTGQLLAARFRVNTNIFDVLTQTGDIRKATGKFKELKADKRQLDHIRKKRGNLKKYYEEHKKLLEDGVDMIHAHLDQIRFTVINLQNLKHALREVYQGDEDLMKKGIPPEIGHNLEIADKHTESEVNDILQDVSQMFGDVARGDNF